MAAPDRFPTVRASRIVSFERLLLGKAVIQGVIWSDTDCKIKYRLLQVVVNRIRTTHAPPVTRSNMVNGWIQSRLLCQ